MIKSFLAIGIGGVLLATYLATVGMAPEFQMAPSASLYVKFQKDGLMPDANAVVENDDVEHSIFEVPEEDERQLKIAISNMDGMDMGAMKMDGMKMEGDGAMKMEGEGTMKMPMADEAETTMKMEGEEKPAMKMKLNPDGSMADDADGFIFQSRICVAHDVDLGSGLSSTAWVWSARNSSSRL